MRRAVFLLALGGLLTGGFALGFELIGQGGGESKRTTSVVELVRAELGNRYYRPVPAQILQLDSVKAMIAALHDPYTEYLNRASYGLLRRNLAASYSGIGVTLAPAANGLVVVGVQAGPGARAGLRVGDAIVRIAGQPAIELGLSGALTHIAGPPGSKVALVVKRGSRSLDLAVARADVRARTVTGHLVPFRDRTFDVIRVSTFGAGTARALGQQLERLRHLDVSGVVLDLRDNPGGLLRQAVQSASYFLRSGSAVVTIEGAHQPRRAFRASGTALVPRLPVVVLVDRSSASSAEVVAAALHDDRRALVVGEPTFGKALVQALYPLGNGSALSLTTARYVTPSGTDISGHGVTPDIHAVDNPKTPTDEALEAALAALGGVNS
jgi:carboxyl-terminal processing protease